MGRGRNRDRKPPRTRGTTEQRGGGAESVMDPPARPAPGQGDAPDAARKNRRRFGHN